MQKSFVPSVGPSDVDIEVVDADLNDLLKRIDGVEQRTAKLLQKIQDEISQCAHYMVESIMAEFLTSVDNKKGRLTQVQKLRAANQTIQSQLKALDEIELT